VLLYLSRDTYIFECKNLVYKIYFWVSYFRPWFLWPKLRSWSFRFYVSIFLLASLSVHCVSPHQRFHKTRRVSTLKTKISYFVFTSLITTYHWVWIVNSRKIARWFQDWRFNYLSKGKIFIVPTLSLSPLCPRTSKRLSMGEEVGTMQFRVQGEQIKKWMSIKKKYIYVWEYIYISFLIYIYEYV
jgi:hypothetical protein